MPPPLYPISAQRARLQGLGIFRVVWDEQGKVSSVRTIKSTGHQMLDDETLRTLNHWRARPGQPLRFCDVPVNFVTSGAPPFHEKIDGLGPLGGFRDR